MMFVPFDFGNFETYVMDIFPTDISVIAFLEVHRQHRGHRREMHCLRNALSHRCLAGL